MIKCKECAFWKKSKIGLEHTNILEGVGNKEAKVFFIFESLFYSDVSTDTFFSDSRYKELLRKYLNQIELIENNIYYTSLMKCFNPDSSKKPNKKLVAKCFETYLEKEIENAKPKILVLVGSRVSKFFLPEITNLKQAVGNYFYSTKYKCYCIPVFDLYYLSNLNQYAPQYKNTLNAFKKIKYLLGKHTVKNYDITYSSNYADLKKLGNVVSVDLETNRKDCKKDPVITIGISDLKNNVVFDKEEIDWKKLIPFLKTKKIIGQNFGYDLGFFKKLGYDLDNNLVGDTRLLQFLINRMGATSLGYMVQVYFEYAYKDLLDITKINEWTPEERKIRCARDNYFQIRLFYKLFKRVKEQGSLNAFKIFTRLIPVLVDMEYHGITIDEKRLNELVKEYSELKEKARAKFIKTLKLSEDFNMNSPPQMQKLLYETLKLPITITTKEGNPSCKAKAIEILGKKKKSLSGLLDYRLYKGRLEKLVGYKEAVQSDGRIHSEFNMFSPRSSRIMSSKPNTQNVDKKSNLKEIFVARKGYTLIYYDFSSLEFRLWALIAKDNKAIEFIKGKMDCFYCNSIGTIDGIKCKKCKGTGQIDKDIHRYVASIYFKKAESKINKEKERDSIKDVVYGSIYGADPEGVAYNKGIELELAKRVQTIFFRLCRKGYFWIQEIEQKIVREKKVRTIFGTYKHLYDLDLARGRKKKHLIDSAKNFTVQSTGAELGFIAMSKIYKAFKKEKIDGHYVNNIHDGDIIEIKNSQLKRGIEIVKANANNPIKLAVPITVEIKVGNSWGNLKEIE